MSAAGVQGTELQERKPFSIDIDALQATIHGYRACRGISRTQVKSKNPPAIQREKKLKYKELEIKEI
jgi:hypothetical protein